MRVIEYVTEPPREIPNGTVLAHNFRPNNPVQRFGTNGFRVFLAELEPGEEPTPCDCAWRGIGPHLTTW